MNLTASPHNWIAPLLAVFIGCVADPGTPDGGSVSIAKLPDLPDPIEPTAFPLGTEQPIRNLSLALVGEVRGELEPCGCPTLPFGGFVRRSTLLEKLRKDTTLFHLALFHLAIVFANLERTDPFPPPYSLLHPPSPSPSEVSPYPALRPPAPVIP